MLLGGYWIRSRSIFLYDPFCSFVVLLLFYCCLDIGLLFSCDCSLSFYCFLVVVVLFHCCLIVVLSYCLLFCLFLCLLLCSVKGCWNVQARIVWSMRRSGNHKCLSEHREILRCGQGQSFGAIHPLLQAESKRIQKAKTTSVANSLDWKRIDRHIG